MNCAVQTNPMTGHQQMNRRQEDYVQEIIFFNVEIGQTFNTDDSLELRHKGHPLRLRPTEQRKRAIMIELYCLKEIQERSISKSRSVRRRRRGRVGRYKFSSAFFGLGCVSRHKNHEDK